LKLSRSAAGTGRDSPHRAAYWFCGGFEQSDTVKQCSVAEGENLEKTLLELDFRRSP
jgi:hypothetical protein